MYGVNYMVSPELKYIHRVKIWGVSVLKFLSCIGQNIFSGNGSYHIDYFRNYELPKKIPAISVHQAA